MLHDAWGQKLTQGCESCLSVAVACVAAGQGRPSWSRWLTAVLLMALCGGTAFMLAPPTALPPPVASWQLIVSGAHLCCNFARPLLQFVQQHHLGMLLRCERCCVVYYAQCSLSCPAAYAFKQIAWERCRFCVHHPFPVCLFYAAILCYAQFRRSCLAVLAFEHTVQCHLPHQSAYFLQNASALKHNADEQ